MKKTLIALTAVLASLSAFGQGAVVFNNLVAGAPGEPRLVDGPVKRADGTGAGAGFTAQLFLVNSDSSLTPLLPATTFRTSSAAAAFYVNAPATAVTVPGIAPGGTANLAFRAFESSAANFEAATVRGESRVSVVLGGGTLPPTNLVGLQGFTMVPEPSTIVLGALGAAALLFRRRK